MESPLRHISLLTVGEKASESSNNTFWGTFSVDDAAL